MSIMSTHALHADPRNCPVVVGVDDDAAQSMLVCNEPLPCDEHSDEAGDLLARCEQDNDDLRVVIAQQLAEITDLREHVERLRCHDRECVENRPGWHHWHANGRIIEQELVR